MRKMSTEKTRMEKEKFIVPKLKIGKNEKIVLTSYNGDGEVTYCITEKLIADNTALLGFRKEYVRWDNVDGNIIRTERKSSDPTSLYK